MYQYREVRNVPDDIQARLYNALNRGVVRYRRLQVV